MSEIIPMTLTKPIQDVGGGEILQLSFREPNGRDLVSAGYPFRLVNSMRSGETVRTIDTAAVTELIARMAGVPSSSVLAMCVWDWTRAMGIVSSFLADPASSKSSTPTSPLENTSAT